MPTVLTRDDRQLLTAARRHLRQTGWTLYHGGGENRGAQLAADWDTNHIIDGKPRRVLSVRLTTPWGTTHRTALEALVDTVTEAVDLGVAIGLLPMGLSSLYRAGIEAAEATAAGVLVRRLERLALELDQVNAYSADRLREVLAESRDFDEVSA